MKIILSFLLMTFTFTSFASEESVFLCVPSKATNGLGISSLLLKISNEDPDAIMKVQYDTNYATESNMSYEGGGCSYALIPYSKEDGEVKVKLKKENDGWKAYVTHESLDTFSQLDCKKWL